MARQHGGAVVVILRLALTAFSKQEIVPYCLAD